MVITLYIIIDPSVALISPDIKPNNVLCVLCSTHEYGIDGVSIHPRLQKDDKEESDRNRIVTPRADPGRADTDLKSSLS